MQRFGERRERRETDAAGDHPRFAPADRPARTAGRAVRGRRSASPGSASYSSAGADADAFVQQRDADRRAVRVAQDLEDRERPPQQRIRCRARLDHHELPGLRERRDLRRREREHVVVARQPACCAITAASTSSEHTTKYTLAGRCAFLRMLTNVAARRRARRSVSDRARAAAEPARANRRRTPTARWFLTLGLFYGIHLAVVFYVLMVAREFFSLETLSPGWVERARARVAGRSVAAVAAALMWLNLRGFAPALSETAAAPDDRRRRGDDRGGRRASR